MGVDLPEGDTVEFDMHPSWAAWFWSLLLLFWTFVWPLYVWLKRKRTRYVITDKRVVVVKGFLSTSTDEYPLQEVRRIQTSQGLGEKVFGVGTITLDTGPGEIKLKAVPNHSTVKNRIRELKSAS